MKAFIDAIPVEFIPKENCLSKDCYRGLKHGYICLEDFFPSFVNKKRTEYFHSSRQKLKPDDYSLSVFKDRNSIEEVLKKCVTLSGEIIGYGIGNTSEDFGIATKPNDKGHISYYLYDYKNNNPWSTFSFIKR